MALTRGMKRKAGSQLFDKGRKPNTPKETKKQRKERERKTVNMKRSEKENEIRFGEGPLREELTPSQDEIDELARSGYPGPTNDSLDYEVDLDEVRRSLRVAIGPSPEQLNKKRREEKDIAKFKQDILLSGKSKDSKKSSTRVKKSDLPSTPMHWDDKVAIDLDIPYHKVANDVEWYTVWKDKGFAIEPGMFDASKYDTNVGERVREIMMGAAFRK